MSAKISPGPWTIETDTYGCKNILDGEGNDIMCTNGIYDEPVDQANADFVCRARSVLHELEAQDESMCDHQMRWELMKGRIATLESKLVLHGHCPKCDGVYSRKPNAGCLACSYLEQDDG